MLDELGDRMKRHERRETDRRLLPLLPIYARLDGRGFTRFTRDMDKPFDVDMSAAMIAATVRLVKETRAEIGYVQSDEISLVWTTRTPEETPLFGGKTMKTASVLAGLATAAFMHALSEGRHAALAERLPHFDARVLQLPTRSEACDMLLWRAQDARRNAISTAARTILSHHELNGVGTRERVDLLANRGFDVDDRPDAFRLGTFVRRRIIRVVMDEDARMRIPEHARPEPGLPVDRTVVLPVDGAPFFGHIVNKEEFVFDGAEPRGRND